MSETPHTADSHAAPADSASRVDVARMVETMAKAIVEKPDEVEVEIEQDGPETVYWLIVSPEDIPRVIGRSGKTIRALRNIVEASGEAQNKRLTLELVEEDDGEDGDGDYVDGEEAQPSNEA